ncbi:HNH endonuclease signature motif containing protein [Aliarcobacter skirrowii]|uniref:HNH endonuclease signature motif containing protein n=1 Tax=Aliarcobacter skirrowii TaxID=28200 RepID=UPI0029A3781D|nr:HNH endonuclease signature motif containing protein [Aliarcobacter skirrowii]MDX4065008.1 HNH endonuclease signature motif containing protein [Aliarcobacter skirrowii]
MSEVQNYEDYWKITNAFTDYNGDKFLRTLNICITFIDTYSDIEFDEEKYSSLQDLLVRELGINYISVRKAINQLVKLGFIKSSLIGYSEYSKAYLQATTNKKRKYLLSKIIYSDSSFNSSITTISNEHQMNFLIKTLVEKGNLSKKEIVALMLVDISSISKGFLSSEELNYYIKESENIGFFERKYNQIGYLTNLLKKLDGLVFVDEDLYFVEDAKRIFGEELDERTTRKRDPYLHNIYKNQLQEESKEFFESDEPKCMLEEISYPVLIASHIKPFIKSNDIEAYDPNNGLLLSRTIDSLFDLNYITFNSNGKIIFSNQVNNDVVEFWKDYKLDKDILNEERLKYLEYHNGLLRGSPIVA